MISQCPHCSQPLKFSQAQVEKFKQALARLPQGRTLKFGCPKCRTPIEVDKDGRLVDKSKTPAPATQDAAGSRPAEPPVLPPDAPDLDWLASGSEQDQDTLEDVPTAMVLVKDEALLGQVSQVLKGQNLQIHCPGSVDEAINALRFKAYEVIVYFTDYEDGPLEVHDFHKFMSGMSMNRRRRTFYVVIGDAVKTLYDLEALTLSANLVVNLDQMTHLDKVFQKGKKGYDALFGPYISMLETHGKS